MSQLLMDSKRRRKDENTKVMKRTKTEATKPWTNTATWLSAMVTWKAA